MGGSSPCVHIHRTSVAKALNEIELCAVSFVKKRLLLQHVWDGCRRDQLMKQWREAGRVNSVAPTMERDCHSLEVRCSTRITLSFVVVKGSLGLSLTLRYACAKDKGEDHATLLSDVEVANLNIREQGGV
eukprot:6471194-Amphidinium_carterae.1